MRPLIRTLLISAALLGSAPLFAAELTVAAVKAYTAKVDAAIARRDVNAVLEAIAEDARISVTVSMQGQPQTMRMSKSQYGQMLQLAWGAVSNYSNKRSNEKISIDGAEATVTADIAESMVINGQQVGSRSREQATVEYINGKLVATKITASEVK
jgi:hypothetical protein